MNLKATLKDKFTTYLRFEQVDSKRVPVPNHTWGTEADVVWESDNPKVSVNPTGVGGLEAYVVSLDTTSPATAIITARANVELNRQNPQGYVPVEVKTTLTFEPIYHFVATPTDGKATIVK